MSGTRSWCRERGATAIEYALMASLIAVVIAFAVTAVGTNLLAIFNDAADMLDP